MRRTIIAISLSLMSIIMFATEGLKRLPERYRAVDTTEVKATIYKPNVGTHTADGFKINKKKAGEHRLIAVSWDLRKKYPFGSTVAVVGAGELDGIYTVKDLMHKKWKRKIDILVDQKHPLVKFDDVKLIKLVDDMGLENVEIIDSTRGRM
jgi:3D (Asp-Asp-Asp) domain-containing protein